MADNEYIAPVDHGVLSATGSVVGGTAVGAVKNGVKTYLYTALTCALIGGVFAVAAPLAAGSALASAFSSFVGWGLVSGLVGAVVVAPFTSVLGGLFGGAKGGIESAERVRAEKGAANMLEAQVQVARSQAPYIANDNRNYGLPAQGTNFNQAGSMVSGIQPEGRMSGVELQRA